MMGDQEPGEEFGCEHCWPPAADDASEAHSALTPVAELIDESHYGVMILACPRCTQRFVSVFTETVDWVDSDDPHYWTLLPITGAEAADLVQQGVALTETELGALGPGRRSLQLDRPKGGARRIFWGTGIHVGWHD